ncbi:viral A-type inclusion protein [uncultured Mediterranean phage uvMED]|nr:viral A-type inclusion protein [uncultured Mediterranean phage uvMED]
MDIKELNDIQLKELRPKIEEEIKLLKNYIAPAKRVIEDFKLKDELTPKESKSLEEAKSQIEILGEEIKEREGKALKVDDEIDGRKETRGNIETALKLIAIDEDIKKSGILNELKLSDRVEVMAKDKEGKEFLKEIKYNPWTKKKILKELKSKLDLDTAILLKIKVANLKRDETKRELEKNLKELIRNNSYFNRAFGEEIKIINGEKHSIHHSERIAKWDKNNLVDFEAKVKKLEKAKSEIDKIKEKEKPIEDRKREYKKIDDLLLEAIVEKYEEGRPEKMEKYLKLRKAIKEENPLT